MYTPLEKRPEVSYGAVKVETSISTSRMIILQNPVGQTSTALTQPENCFSRSKNKRKTPQEGRKSVGLQPFPCSRPLGVLRIKKSPRAIYRVNPTCVEDTKSAR